MNKVVTFGEIMLRLSAPGYLRLSQSNHFDVSFAGAEANVAVSLANYGMKVDYITRLPDNPIAEKCIRELLFYRVDCDNILRGGKRIGVLYIETGSNARPSHVYYDREDSAIATMNPDEIDWKGVLKDAAWFHWTGITPALSENAAESCRRAIKAANEVGVTVSCDINFRGNLWKYGRTAAEIMPELVAGSDIILGNEEDCEKVFGIRPQGFDASKTNGEVNQTIFTSVCEQMMQKFHRCKKMVVTLRGAINANHNTWSGVLYDGKQLLQSKKYDITDIVDRVGGGDSFMGALIYGLMNFEGDDQKTLEFAVAASALKHTIKGDYNQISINEISELLEGNTSGRVKR
ncbi:kinase, PfkB family [Bacteroides intestinalis]|uniref:Kinase, PfkB family n=2 Tax=Bacteroides intestinalis TaxID=329854 RepID=A0A139LI77_9BACE|nr:kinase, PfkB family [Bacteroides intestinalis]